ncbi:hypothetical protein ACI78V_21920 [Geodermatophilus sp. SYSU D00742]
MTEPSRPRPVPGPPRPGPRPAPGPPEPATGAAPVGTPPEAQGRDAAGQQSPGATPDGTGGTAFADLAQRPPAEHVAVFEAEHARLQRELATIDQL